MSLPDSGTNEFHLLLDGGTYESGIIDGGFVSSDDAVSKVLDARCKPT
jgi:hypothetical protein